MPSTFRCSCLALAMATVVSGSHMMHLTGKMGHVTVSMQFAYKEESGQFVMDDCTKQTCRFEIMKPKGSDEQGSFTGQLTLLMPGMYDLNLKSDDESLAFQGIFSSEYGGYEFDGQMVHGTNVQDLKMSQVYDDVARAELSHRQAVQAEQGVTVLCRVLEVEKG